MDKLYLITINKTGDRYHVRCTLDEITAWTEMLFRIAGRAVVFTEVRLSDFDEINHNHFC